MKKKELHKPGFGNRGELLVLMQGILAIGFILLPRWPMINETGLFQTLAVVRLLLLVVCWAIAVLLAVSGFISIRKQLTPLPYPVDNNQLVQTGVYAVVRHPLYSSMLLAALGWTIFAFSLSHLLWTGLSYLLLSYKASKEELWLTERHPEYTDYARRVGRFIPRTGRKNARM